MPKNLLTDLAADLIWSAEIVSPDVYGGLTESFKESNDAWTQWATCEQPQSDPLPLEW